MADPKDPRRIALIAVRTGPGDGGAYSGHPQAIVIGEVPVDADGTKIVDPTVVASFTWQWRYALFQLDDLERLLANASRESGKKPWPEIPHPLGGPGAFAEFQQDFYKPTYYDMFGPAPTVLLDSDERADVLSADELSASLLAKLREPINPYIDDAGTKSPNPVSRLNFAIPLRDVVRLAIYDKDTQPFGASQAAAGGPLMVLDTCRYIKAGGAVDPERPTPNSDPPGTRILLFPDPMAVATGGPGANKQRSAEGKLLGFAVLAEVRLPLNGHDTSDGRHRGFFRFYAAKIGTQRDKDTLFARVATSSKTPSLGPLFDNMRVGYTRGSHDPHYITLRRNACLSELCDADARASDDTAGLPAANHVPILDTLKIGFVPSSVIRTLGFRLIDAARMALRFEAIYFITHDRDLKVPFAPSLQLGARNIRFAQEQPSQAVNWVLSPSQQTRWIFTARSYNYASDEDITKAIIDAFNARVEELHAGLRQVQDATPISLLPLLTIKAGDKDANGNPLVPARWTDGSKRLYAPAWHFVGSMVDRRPYARTITTTTSSPREIDAEFLTLEPRFIRDMFHGADWLFDNGKPKGPFGITGEFGVSASAEFPRLVLTSGATPTYDVILSAPVFTDPSEAQSPPWVRPPAFQPAGSGRDPVDAYRGVMLGIKIIKKTASTKPARIGALQMDLQSAFPDSLEPGGMLRLLALEPGSNGGLIASAIDALVKLPIGSVLPAGQDDLPSDARITTQDRVLDALRESGPDPDAPLLLPLTPPTETTEAKLTLFANETVARHRNHTVQLSLKAIQVNPLPAPHDASDKLLVIDPAPFRIAVVKTRNLADAQTNESNEVAVWNAAGENGLSWRLASTDGAVSLLLPPQVIGEAMEKDRGIEEDRPADIAEGVPAAARFGSATRLDLSPSFFDTRYVEPGWNLRRIMGYPGQRAPGAGLRDLRLELMYGIMTRLKPSDAGVRVAEIGAVIGAPVNNISADGPTPTVRAYIQAFNAIRRAQDCRLAVDRLWQGDALDELTIEQDASFKLRTRAVPRVMSVTIQTPKAGDTISLNVTPSGGTMVSLGYAVSNPDSQAVAQALVDAINGSDPLKAANYSADAPSVGSFNLHFATPPQAITANVSGAGATTTVTFNSAAASGPLTAFRWPVPGGVPADLDPALRDTFVSEDVDKDSDARSFPGGVPWAFESSNILRSVYRNVASDGGWARSVHLSALGGWGTQRGLFDHKLTAITTETTMGRVHRYALERVGRVGALWNKAKHIIVYERSVVPSAQFYNTAPIGLEQDQLRGRPVLRKVEEYVELIEQVRRYPEQGSAIEAAGCLTGVEFVARRIRVDSRWGGDVRKEGWQVPLWNKAFDQPPENADNPDDPTFVYPKPQIRFLVMGEGGMEKALEIAEPEKLTFYTTVDLRKGETDDTDTWHPVCDIDFIDLPLPQAGKRTPVTGDLHDGLLPPEPEHVTGYERLTIGIVPSKETVSITHGRQDKGPAAQLRNVTIGRATSAAPSKPDPTAVVVTKVADAISSFRVDLDALTGRLSEAARVAATLPNASPASIKQAIKDAAAKLPIADQVKNLTKKFTEADKKWPDRNTVTGLAKSLCDEQANRITAEVKAQFDRATGRVDQLVTTIDATLTGEANQIKATAALLVGQITDAKKKIVKDLIGGLSQRLTDLSNATGAGLSQAAANADSIATKIGAGVDSIILKLDAQKEAAKTSIDSALDNITNNQLPAAAAALNTATRQFGAIRAQIGQFMTEASSNALPQPARTVLMVLDSVLNKVEATIATALSALNTDLVAAKAAVEDAKKKIDEISDKLDARTALSATGSAVTGVTKAIDKTAQQVQDAVLQQLQPAQDLIKKLGDDIDGLPTDQITTRLNELADKIAAVPTGLKNNVDSIKQALDTNVQAAQTTLVTAAKDVCGAFEGAIDQIYNTADTAKAWIDDQLAGYQAQLDQALDGIAGDVAQLAQNAQNAVTQVGRQMEARARETLGGLQQRAADYLGGRDPADLAKEGERIFQQGSDTLRLLRAVGDPPKTDQLGFNRPQVAYVFQEANKIVDMTPAISLVNRVADSAAALGAAAASANDLLTSFGIRLPASSIGDQLMPDALKNLDISKMFPDFSGIKLDGLFKNLGFPDLTDSKAVKVTHGFDQAQLSAWLQADVDVPFASAAPLMDFGPIQIMIDQAEFTASARVAAGRAGTQKSMHGKLFGDWRLVCAGQDILMFQQTGLTFDETGRINFNIQPDRVVLADALQFLTDMIESTGEGGDFEIVPYMFGGVPSGIAACLDLDLPPIQTGVFGIDDLSLHVLFGVTALPEFEIFVELGVGAMTAPFTLNVWILNGGGFVTTRLSYLPMAKPAPLLMFTLQVGIVAGVGLAFSFGVVSGGVYVQVGCAIAITWTTGPGGSTTAVTVFLLIRGNVDVAGLITIGLSLLLAITYDGSQMVASGTLNLSIKISVFFTLNVTEHVEYNFAGEKKESRSVSYSSSFE
ncbi:hypothetical protein JQ543_27915 [Bradyrhizobium diazoefficiens]|nr:hypothetical protein [Bradyrhizobium diazoefficiens]MBR0851600.1 hypothetical protein [Bradyrhizobium diazoefficiens]